MLSREELKKRACEAIDKNRDKIIELGDSIFAEPELGYKEFKTANKLKKYLTSWAMHIATALPEQALLLR